MSKKKGIHCPSTKEFFFFQTPKKNFGGSSHPKNNIIFCEKNINTLVIVLSSSKIKTTSVTWNKRNRYTKAQSYGFCLNIWTLVLFFSLHFDIQLVDLLFEKKKQNWNELFFYPKNFSFFAQKQSQTFLAKNILFFFFWAIPTSIIFVLK